MRLHFLISLLFSSAALFTPTFVESATIYLKDGTMHGNIVGIETLSYLVAINCGKEIEPIDKKLVVRIDPSGGCFGPDDVLPESITEHHGPAAMYDKISGTAGTGDAPIGPAPRPQGPMSWPPL